VNVDFDDETSRQLSLVRYREYVIGRPGGKGDAIFGDVLKTTNLRY
jgi:hypothetical protein